MEQVIANHFTRALAPIDRSGITELVVERIRELLEQGELRAGSRLPPERELAGMLQISRPSLRTALKALSVMGIIHARPGAGTYITDSVHEIFHQPMRFHVLIHQSGSAELFEARRIIETGLAELAAERAKFTDLKALAAEVEGMRQTMNDPEKFLEHDVRFHRAIARAAGNTVMSGVMDTLMQMLYQARRDTIRRASDLDAAIEWHAEIYDAISRRDKQRAGEMMFRHLRAAEKGWESEQIPTAKSADKNGLKKSPGSRRRGPAK
ncbi:MAG TPA: FadR/GntR family transcriptional regulator [Blastocatellia bacterium]|nr:FadR/GntR family transcriptional regulator [Blastocatellia bacterium]